MNWRRGLFRLWIVGAALFALAVAAMSYEGIKKEFDDIARRDQWDRSKYEVVLPQQCGLARGVAGTDYTTKYGRDPGPWDLYATPDSSETCWYGLSKFRPLYPEFQKLSDEELTRKLYADNGQPIHELPNPWMTLGYTAGFAFGIPFVVLVLGASLVWAFSGFAGTRSGDKEERER